MCVFCIVFFVPICNVIERNESMLYIGRARQSKSESLYSKYFNIIEVDQNY